MATATVTIKVSPVELKTICDALKVYADIARARARNETPIVPKFTGQDPRRAYALARDIWAKIGYYN